MTQTLQSMREFPLLAPLRGVRLAVHCSGAGLPEEAFSELYALTPQGEILPVRSLRELLPFVQHCSSGAEARELLSLETSPASHFLFTASPGIEVRVRDTLEKPGDLLACAAQRLGYREPVMVTEPDGFASTRDLLRFSPRPGVLVRRCEHISRDAVYSLRSETRLGSLQEGEALRPEYE